MPMSPRLLRPRAASGFDPRRIAGIEAWWDFSDTSTLTIDTGISAVADKSGNGRTASQTTGANQPLSVANQLNGLAVADFAVSGNRLATANIANDLAAFSSFVVFRARTYGGASFGRLWTRNDNQRGVWVDDFGLNNRRSVVAQGAIGHTTPNGSVQSNTWYYHTATSTGGNSPTVAANINGASVALTAAAGSYNTQSVANQPFVIGNRSAGDRTFDGFIGEVLIYGRALTASEISAIEQYIARKWGF
jgi:hypothetical protein